ncbi:MAG: amidohydrolase family protein, partial [Planctomycetota bacterium]
IASARSPSQLQPLVDAVGIDRVISVQARQNLEETYWLAKIASDHPSLIAGTVGWVHFANANIEQVLSEVLQSQHAKYILGFRHVVQDEPDDDFLLREDFSSGVGALLPHDRVFDILIYARQLPATLKFVDRHPNQTFVLDHIAKPAIPSATSSGRPAEMDAQWERLFRELAKRSNVACKFSGVVTEIPADASGNCDWDAQSIRPYWDVALEAFGAQRLMFGSDWPVALLRTGYQQWVTAVQSLAGQLSEDEQKAFWGGNASKAYKTPLTQE